MSSLQAKDQTDSEQDFPTDTQDDAAKESTTKAPPDSDKKMASSETFPEHLYNVIKVGKYKDAIQWTEKGDTFWILPKEFADTVLKEHFQGTKFGESCTFSVANRVLPF